MSTSYIFLAGAMVLFLIAILILFTGKGKKDEKKISRGEEGGERGEERGCDK